MISAATARIRARLRDRDDQGFTLVELIVTMFVSLLVMALVLPVIQASVASTTTTRNQTSASAAARVAIENLQAQAASAIQLCLPTQLVAAGSTITSGFALRENQTTGPGTSRWEQWTIIGSNLEEEQFTPGGTGNWEPVATGIANTTIAPFTLPQSAPGSPQQLAIDLQVGSAPTVELQASAAGFDTPYTLAPATPCSTAEPTD